MLEGALRSKRILVCVGPGGVGKTTTAAALGAMAARMGRSTLVCTIDPAPRLADALEMGTLESEPRPVPPETARALGVSGDGLLSAVRLDTRQAFGRLVEEQVVDPAMRRRIFDNEIYRQITTTLTGSQEYAATLALYDLATQGRWDLIVLDTPPTANALDFLEAPHRIAEAVASPAIRWFSRPPDRGGRFSLRHLGFGGAAVMHKLAKFVGSQFLDDVAAFFVDFHAVLDGFLARANAIEQLLRSPDTGFLLVLAPELPAVNEALFFHERLRAAGIPLGAFIANRVHERPGLVDADQLQSSLERQAVLHGCTSRDVHIAAERLARMALEYSRLCDSERRELQRLVASAPGVLLTSVPLLEQDVDSLAALRVIGEHLASVPGEEPTRAATTTPAS